MGDLGDDQRRERVESLGQCGRAWAVGEQHPVEAGGLVEFGVPCDSTPIRSWRDLAATLTGPIVGRHRSEDPVAIAEDPAVANPDGTILIDEAGAAER